MKHTSLSQKNSLEWMWGAHSYEKRQRLLQLEDRWESTAIALLTFLHDSTDLLQYELLCRVLLDHPPQASTTSRHNLRSRYGGSDVDPEAVLRPVLESNCAWRNVVFLSGPILKTIAPQYALERESQYRCLLASMLCLIACDVTSLSEEAKRVLTNNIKDRQTDLHSTNIPASESSTRREYDISQTDSYVFATYELTKRLPSAQKILYVLVGRVTNVLNVALAGTSAAFGTSAVNLQVCIGQLQAAFGPINPKSEESADKVFSIVHATFIVKALHVLATVLEGFPQHGEQARKYLSAADVLAREVLYAIFQHLKTFEEGFWTSNSGQYRPHSRNRSVIKARINRSCEFNRYYKTWILFDCAIDLKQCVHGCDKENEDLERMATKIAYQATEEALRVKAKIFSLTSIGEQDRERYVDDLLKQAENISRSRRASVEEEVEAANHYLPTEDQFNSETLLDPVQRLCSSFSSKGSLHIRSERSSSSGSSSSIVPKILTSQWKEPTFHAPRGQSKIELGASAQIFKDAYDQCSIAMRWERGSRGNDRLRKWAFFSSATQVSVYEMDEEIIDSQTCVYRFPSSDSGFHRQKAGSIRKIRVNGTCLVVVADAGIWAVDFSHGWSQRRIGSLAFPSGFNITAAAVHNDGVSSFVAVANPRNSKELAVEVLELVAESSATLAKKSKILVPTSAQKSIKHLEFSADGERLLATTDDNTIYIYRLVDKAMQAMPFIINMKYGQPGVGYPPQRGISASSLFTSPSGKTYVLVGTAPASDRALSNEGMYELPFISPVANNLAACPPTLVHPLYINMGDILAVAVSPCGTLAALADNKGEVLIQSLASHADGGICQRSQNDLREQRRQPLVFSKLRRLCAAAPRCVSLRWIEEGGKLTLLAVDNLGRSIRVVYEPAAGKGRAGLHA